MSKIDNKTSLSLNAALEVISIEERGLTALRHSLGGTSDDSLGHSFIAALSQILKNPGRLVATGMGKSGHVARKIAATFASTGVPAGFVHPAEASHGDLGMINPDTDLLLALSNSGETAELNDVIVFSQRFKVPMIAITSDANSTLARAADIALVMPEAQEACRITLAPTTSSLMMMALGDALAVAVMQAKGFTADQFHQFHPGGRLGAALKRVTDLMHHTDMPVVAPDTSVELAVEVINDKGFGCVGVVDDKGVLIGMVTDGDIRRQLSKMPQVATIDAIMTKSPFVVPATSLAAEALSELSRRKITAVFIVDEHGRPLGLLHVHDCLSIGVV